mgnify:CR=1 FL=1
MLHRAAAEREQADINRVILAAEAGIVPHHFGFGQAGNADRGLAVETAKTAFHLRRIRQVDAAAVGRSGFEDQGLVDHQRAIAGVGGDGILRGHGQILFLLGGAAFAEHVHANAPSRATAKASTSSSLTVSVTATIRPWASDSSSG